jgi:hypothetical protein
VTVSPGQSGSGFAPASTLIPGIAPVSAMILTSGVASFALWRIV